MSSSPSTTAGPGRVVHESVSPPRNPTPMPEAMTNRRTVLRLLLLAAVAVASDADLDTARQMINADTAHDGASTADYKLTADLDYSQDTSNTTGAATANWSGIDWFSGTFDGDGHTISNLNFTTDSFTATLPASTAPAGSGLGLFRVLDRATVKNLTLQNVHAAATTSNSSAGAVAVWSFASTVSRVELDASTIGPATGGGASWVGGLVALAYANEYADANSSVTDGQSSTFADNKVSGGSVSDNNRTGGIVGMATGPTTVVDNYVNTTLSNPGTRSPAPAVRPTPTSTSSGAWSVRWARRTRRPEEPRPTGCR
jgi:hypothetical protein